MPQKLTIEEVRQRFEEGVLLSTEYLGCMKPLKYKCSCGSENVHEITLNSFDRGIRCHDCTKARREATFTERYGVPYLSKDPNWKEKMLSGIKEYVDDKKYKIEEVREILEKDGCELISTEYLNSVSPIEIKFACGHVGVTKLRNFLQGHRCSSLRTVWCCMFSIGARSQDEDSSDEFGTL